MNFRGRWTVTRRNFSKTFSSSLIPFQSIILICYFLNANKKNYVPWKYFLFFFVRKFCPQIIFWKKILKIHQKILSDVNDNREVHTNLHFYLFKAKLKSSLHWEVYFKSLNDKCMILKQFIYIFMFNIIFVFREFLFVQVPSIFGSVQSVHLVISSCLTLSTIKLIPEYKVNTLSHFY